ncbi:MAG: 50S ribosomal protein L4 [Anaerolineae bacterium]|nr:50S ribosomal protein L4 [Anaerolineae bacterium]MCB9132778.1 50S ribosomal protein L4 [Anaerolineales bacterium]MCB0227756.1 50S ribosomal protein L4 [Anaerolineae bacterium]MCB0232752.1 50S ribosomal protein L4 [Anaerolineae bacterium]MCB0238304.1 50S ribosomal protein L4 [Anaerolineae bacterium]
MLIPVVNMAGERVDEMELRDEIFAAPVNKSVMHQALIRQLANARRGTHKVKGRSDVRGGGRKPWRQKGTGRARQGSTRSPQWRGGGVVFGPTPRSYEKKMPRKMRRIAMRSALSLKTTNNQLVVVKDLSLAQPKTRDFVDFLGKLDLQNSVLVLLADRNDNVELSARNLPDVKTLLAGYVNVRDVLGHETLVLTPDTVAEIERILG